tara:strand:+ start:18124 stop:18621 length:498 start_codon:yes stop_codon:yes gene_type:complete
MTQKYGDEDMEYDAEKLLTLKPHTRTKVRGVSVYDVCLFDAPIGLTVVIDKKDSCYWMEIGTGLEYTGGTWHTRYKIAYWGGRSTIAEGLTEQVGVHLGQTSRHMGDVYALYKAQTAAIAYILSDHGQLEVVVAQLKIAKHHALHAKKASASAGILQQWFSGELY